MIADIKIKQVFDKIIQTYVNKEYYVINVKDRIKIEEQIEIF